MRSSNSPGMASPYSPSPGAQQGSLLAQLIRFSHYLHSYGITVDPSRMIDLCRCVSLIDLRQETDLFAASRASLLSRNEDLALFERLFRQFWYQQEARESEPDTDEGGPSAPQQDDGQQSMQGEQLSTGETREAHESPSCSRDEILMHKDLGSMTATEIERARRLIAELIGLIANTRSRRHRRDKRGDRVNFQRMLRHTVISGQDSVALEYWKRKIRKSRLILLCDVSGSMEQYGRFLIQFIYGIYQGLAQLDVAVFSTRMTIITDHLRSHSVDASLEAVAGAVHDWAGGTNIGACLQEFNHQFAHKMATSRTFVIILSDGWDRGDTQQLRREMLHLSNNAESILWMNPLLGNADYQPLCKGIKAALPAIDYFLPAHNLESFARLIQQLRAIW